MRSNTLLKLLATTGAAMIVAQASAGVRVVHASPDAPNVDVVVNDDFAAPAFVNAPFQGVTGYAPLPTGNYNFKVVPTGLNAPVVIDATLPIDGNTDYTVAATGLLAGIQPAVYVDDNSLISDKARVRFIHLSPDAPAVDIGLAGGGSLVYSDVEFRENGGYRILDPGTYDLDVLVAGTSNIALSLNDISLSPNTVYTVYAMGQLSNGSLGAVISVDAVPEPTSLMLLAVGALAMLRRR